MIIDHLKNSSRYAMVHPNFQKAFDFIQKAVEEDLPIGKYEVDGDAVYGIVQAYDSKAKDDCKLEGHKRYIDIQYMVSGCEAFEIADIAKVTEKTEYNDIKDVLYFHDADHMNVAVLQDQEFGIFFPWDIHRPGIAVDGKSQPVKKIVMKVKV